MNMKWLFLFSLIFLLSCNADVSTNSSKELSGKVVSIADGDTFTLLTGDNRQVKVRLHGIDCPEKKQDYGTVARQKLSDLVFQRQVTVEQKDVDRYKRVVGIVYNDQELCVNEELLKSGLAWHYTQYDKNPAWSSLERKAREQKAGLWSKAATPPWEWRKEKRKK
jgi:micrococcal nuclease